MKTKIYYIGLNRYGYGIFYDTIKGNTILIYGYMDNFNNAKKILKDMNNNNIFYIPKNNYGNK